MLEKRIKKVEPMPLVPCIKCKLFTCDNIKKFPHLNTKDRATSRNPEQKSKGKGKAGETPADIGWLEH